MEHPPPAEGAAPQDAHPRTLEELFRAYESPLLAYAMRLTRHADSAQDCVQEAFLRLHPRLAAGEVREPRAWLYRTIHNLAISGHRAANRVIPFEADPSQNPDNPGPLSPSETLADSAPLPDDQLQNLESADLVRLVLDRLDARSRQVVTLKFYENLSYKDIALQTGLTVGHVGYILHHALKSLALELAKAGLTA